MRVFIKYLSVIINVLFAACVFLGMLSTKISPERNFILPYFGLLFPFFYFLQIVFLLFWAINKKWWILLPIVVLIMSFPYICNIFPINFNHNKTVQENKSYSIVTYNISLFGEDRMADKIIDEIRRIDADFLCFQEFGFYTNGHVCRSEVLARLHKLYPYSHIWFKNQRSDIEYGVATFSKYPIVRKKKLYYPSQYNISIFSDILLDRDTIRLFNNHLESTKFSLAEKKEVRAISSDNLLTSQTFDLTERLSKKMGKAYQIRARQADEIAYEINKSPYPTLICGDFNDLPVSYVYEKIKGTKHRDLFVETSFGYGYTFHDGIFALRIDHILVSSHFVPIEAEIIHADYSDHYPVFGRVCLRSKIRH